MLSVFQSFVISVSFHSYGSDASGLGFIQFNIHSIRAFGSIYNFEGYFVVFLYRVNQAVNMDKYAFLGC